MSKVTHLTLDEGGGLNRRRIHLREISGDADAPLETVGQDLRAARLRRGDDLATVSKVLKIRKDHLEALEEDRLEALPGRTYAIGFTRSYADYLGLDPVVSVERFKREIAGRDEAPQPSVFTEQQDERQLPHGWLIIAVVVLGLVVYGANRLWRSADTMLAEPVAPVPARMAPPPARTAPAAAQPAPTSTAPASTGAADAPSVNSSPAGDNTAATAPGSVPPAAVTGTAVPAPAGAKAVPPAEPAPIPPGHVYGAHNTGSRVVLQVLRATRILVQAKDGTAFINRTLAPGDSYRVPDIVGLTLTTPDAGAINLELDGQPMGTAGAPRQMTEAQPLDPQAIVDRYNGGQRH